MSLPELPDDLVRAYARAMLDAGATPELIEHATKVPRLLAETIESYQRDLARVIGTTKRHYYPAMGDLSLDNKVANRLRDAGITTTIELCACSSAGLASLRLVGARGAVRADEALQFYGLRLRHDDEPYARRVLELTSSIKNAPVSLLHMWQPKEWFGLQHAYKYLHVSTIGELMRHGETKLRTAEYLSGGARVRLFNSFTVTDTVTTLRELGLSLKKE